MNELAGKTVAAICHAGWVPISAGILRSPVDRLDLCQGPAEGARQAGKNKAEKRPRGRSGV